MATNDNTTIDTRTEAERRYDAERDGSLYLRPVAAEIAADHAVADPIAALRAQIDATEDYETRRRLIFRLFDTIIATDTAPAGGESDTLAGYLPDGTPIHGEYLIGVEPKARWGVVAVDYPGWRITMDHDGYFTIANDAGGGETLCDEWHMRDLPTRRAAVSHLLLSDTLERLHAAAVAWERGDMPTPAAPVASPMQAEHQIEVAYAYRAPDGDLVDEPIGPIACTDFTLGDGLTKVLIGDYSGDKPGIELVIGGTCINDRIEQVITLADVRQLRDNLTALLSDPRVLAACAEAGAPVVKQAA